MALRNTGTPAPAAPSPFEPEDDDTVTSTVEAQEAAPAAAAAAPEAPTAAPIPASVQRAVANVVQGAVATATSDAGKAFAEEAAAMRGAADFSYGNYKVFKGNNGDIMETNGVKLGRWVKVTMLAWDDHYEISPGSKSEKSKDAVGYSKDGVTIDSIIGEKYQAHVGTPVADYVRFLQTDADYPEARASRFVDIAAIVHEADSEDSLNGEVIQVTLSKSSIPSFESYQQQLLMKAKAASKGLGFVKIPEDPFTFYFVREVTTKGDNTWTKLRVTSTLPPKL